ncbi:MAG: hypothetical protein M1607_03545 [Patescibacteria group bacterium]|nr:hypothetical protein [Patescibacteria group bacterium]
MARSVLKKVNKRKSIRRSSSSRSKLGLGLFALGLVVLLIIIGKLISFIVGLGQPYAPDALPVDKYYSWNGTNTINLAIKSDQIYLVSVNPIDKAATIITVPDKAYLDLPHGFGQWLVSSIYGLGQDENPPMGAQLLKETLALNLAIPVDGYLIFTEDLSQTPVSEMLDRIRKSPWDSLNLIQQSKTDLSLVELVKLAHVLSSIRSDKVDNLDLQSSEATNWQVLADGSRVLSLKQSVTDQYVMAHMYDNQIEQEGLTVGIYNSTAHPLLAEQAARVITNLGGRVIFTANSQDDLANTLILGKQSWTKQRATQAFRPSCLQRSSSLFFSANQGSCDIISGKLGEAVDLNRADITIILGEDFYTDHSNR